MDHFLGGNSVTGWGLAFGHIADIALMGFFILRKLGRIDRLARSLRDLQNIVHELREDA